jgi:hypothetical protein
VTEGLSQIPKRIYSVTFKMNSSLYCYKMSNLGASLVSVTSQSTCLILHFPSNLASPPTSIPKLNNPSSIAIASSLKLILIDVLSYHISVSHLTKFSSLVRVTGSGRLTPGHETRDVLCASRPDTFRASDDRK